MASRLFSDVDLSPDELQQHILSTYTNIRVGIGVIGIVFPFFLWLVGHFYAHLPLQGSMSAYYHATGYECRSMRNWFVGLLFVVGIFLYLYKGFSRGENWALNLAGAFAVGVAIFPMPWPASSSSWITRHGFCAVGLFLCIAYVALFRADDTLDLIRGTNISDPNKVIDRLKHLYRLIGVAMIVSILAAYSLNSIFKTGFETFWEEAAGILSFGAYWLLKSWELRSTAVELKTLRAQVKRTGGRLMSVAPNSTSKSQPQ